MTPEPCTRADVDALAAEVAALRPMLVRLARQRVRNPAWAEDAVSETIVAALERPQPCAGRARTQAWLVGILKHKLVDQVRRHTRECQLGGADGDDDPFDELLATRASPWQDPQARLAARELVEGVQRCLQALPPQQGRAFLLRECLEQETEEVCRVLGVNANHLGVMLFRARQRLRAALAPHRPLAAAGA